MFIRKHTSGGYDRDGQQRSGRGDYLALFSWNDYKALDEIKARCPDCWQARDARQAAIGDEHWPAYVWRQHCQQHSGQIKSGLPIPTYGNGKPMLWAIVRQCSLSQMGHFMSGHIRIGGQSLYVEGPIGSNGLPLNYQDCPEGWRTKLTPVPESVAAVYWADNGHNDIGSAAPTLRGWALETFQPESGK